MGPTCLYIRLFVTSKQHSVSLGVLIITRKITKLPSEEDYGCQILLILTVHIKRSTRISMYAEIIHSFNLLMQKLTEVPTFIHPYQNNNHVTKI